MADKSNNKNLKISIGLNVIITIFEIVLGIVAGSLALISEAIHNFSDVGAMGLTMWGEKIKKKANNDEKTYGYKRAEIIIAFINTFVLLLILIFILYEAISRLFHPSGDVNGLIMMIVAVVALVGNGIATYLLEKDSHKNLNLKSAWMHSLQDALFSIGVLLGAVLIYFFHFNIIDPIISIVISIYLFKEVYKLIVQTIDILMESVPSDISFQEVKSTLESYKGVTSTHDLHIWQTDSNSRLLSVHLEVDNLSSNERNQLILKAQSDLLAKYKIGHVTIQMVDNLDKKTNLNCEHCN
jgi:cobalt-zinc-cadmium efflux system protein